MRKILIYSVIISISIPLNIWCSGSKLAPDPDEYLDIGIAPVENHLELPHGHIKDGEEWFLLIESKTGFKLEKGPISVKSRGCDTGNVIVDKVSWKDQKKEINVKYLLRGDQVFNPGHIYSVNIGRNFPARIKFKGKDVVFKRITKPVNPDKPDSSYRFMDLIMEINGMKQSIFKTDLDFSGEDIWISWVGDLDGDEEIDFIMSSLGLYGSSATLYLSSKSDETNFVKAVANGNTANCD